MGSIFSAPSPPPPPPPPPLPPIPTADDPEVKRAAEQRRLSERKRRGRRSTILTSGLGDPSTAPVGRPTLTRTQLGG
jgi:hypothetical protein